MAEYASLISPREKVAEIYNYIREFVVESGFQEEIEWQDQIRFSHVTESDFLRESAWVILSSGMRESVIRNLFPDITEVFYSWQKASVVVRNSEQCKKKALVIFNHSQKVSAIIEVARQIDDLGFQMLKSRIDLEGVKFIESLPFMGPATSYHLAKNIGLDCVKPDRHLLRVAAATGYESPRQLCEDISMSVGDRISVVDLVLWRYATLNPNYLNDFT